MFRAAIFTSIFITSHAFATTTSEVQTALVQFTAYFKDAIAAHRASCPTDEEILQREKFFEAGMLLARLNADRLLACSSDDLQAIVRYGKCTLATTRDQIELGHCEPMKPVRDGCELQWSPLCQTIVNGLVVETIASSQRGRF